MKCPGRQFTILHRQYHSTEDRPGLRDGSIDLVLLQLVHGLDLLHQVITEVLSVAEAEVEAEAVSEMKEVGQRIEETTAEAEVATHATTRTRDRADGMPGFNLFYFQK